MGTLKKLRKNFIKTIYTYSQAEAKEVGGVSARNGYSRGGRELRRLRWSLPPLLNSRKIFPRSQLNIG